VSGVERLLQPPWFQILIGVAVIFALWFAYLMLPLVLRGFRLLANAIARRHDRRTLGWLVATILIASGAAGAHEVLTTRTSPEVQYFVTIAMLLVVVLVGVLLIVAFITWTTIAVFQIAGRPLLNRGYLVFVGWHMLRSHRAEAHSVGSYEGGHGPTAAFALVVGLLCAAAAWFANLVPWSRLVGDLSVAVPSIRIGLAVVSLALITWPLRRARPVGRIDLFDKLEARIKNLPDLLTVTVTTFISIVGVGVGVWALVVVLSVMGGFENDLRSKILSTNPHVVIQDDEPMEGIDDVRGKLEKLRQIAGVTAAIPYVQGDVIITSRENRNVSLTLRGIDPADISGAEHHLTDDVVSGGLQNLMAPERIVPSTRWRLRQMPPSPDGDGPDDTPDAPAPDAPAPVPGGIEPTPIPTGPAAGELEEGIRPGILLGEELAMSLRAAVGSEVTVISPRDDAGFLGIQPRARTFRVAGIFHTGMYEFDLKLAYVRMSEAQRFFHMDSDINRIELRLADVDASGDVVAAVTPLLKRPSLRALDWKHLNRNLFSALALEKIVMFIVLGFIILVASFNVIGSLIMIIMEKTREIAILKSMGATSREVRRMFLVLGGFIGGIGSAAGLTVGLLTCWIIRYVGIELPRQYYIEELPVHVEPLTISGVFVCGIALCMLATLYPATEAARIHPVEGLRYD